MHPRAWGKGIKEILWIQGGFKKINACDRALISNEKLKWGDILDVEILCLQVWEGWWYRVSKISVQDTMAPVSSSKTEGITTDENIFNEVDICRFTWKQRCTHR